jgi:hypothetical protein
MVDFERKINTIVAKIKNYFIGTEKIEGKATIKKKQYLNLILAVIIVFVSFLVLLLFLSGEKKQPENNKVVEEILDKHKAIELASDATKGAVKWQNFLEESIEEEGNKRQTQIDILKQTIATSVEATKEESSKEVEEIKARLSYALSEIDRMKADNQNLQNDIASLGRDEDTAQKPAELGITSIVESISTMAPVSSFNHIPATSYVSGHLLGGISVSTSVNSASEPIPVVIKLTGRGNLPAAFAVDIKQCRLLASCYGDISSERAIIRAEELVCEDKEAELIISTKVAGVIYGDDGANGIRGTVVSMSDKHLKNAFFGGVLSGFSSTAKGQGGLNITSLGAVSTQKRGARDMAEDGLMGGTSTAAEKLADYHIKLAENISPVILIPGGTKVDIMFTKSVEIGSFDVEEAINSARKTNHAK